MPKLAEEVQALAAEVDAKLKTAAESAPGADAPAKRALFGTYATLWASAEEVDDQDAMKALQEVRLKLRYRPPKATLPDKVMMIARLLLTVWVASWGCMCVLAVTPLRWMNPILKALGVPNGVLPMDVVLTMWARAVLAAAGVKVKLEGKGAKELWGPNRSGVVVYNHGSNLDPFIVSHICHAFAPKYIGKKVLFKLPFFGWMSLATGMVPINRGDRESAVRTMNETVGNMQKSGRSVAVAPEGTRTTDGHLGLPFKKGTFHMQEQTQARLLPMVIFGAYELWPPGQLFTRPGEVTVRILPEQTVDGAAASCKGSRLALQRSMAKCLAQHPESGARPLSGQSAAECVVRLLCVGVVYRQFWNLFVGIAGALGLGAKGVLGVFSVTTGVVALLVDFL